VLYDANVITVDFELPRAQAIAIWMDRFLAVGSSQEIPVQRTMAERRWAFEA